MKNRFKLSQKARVSVTTVLCAAVLFLTCMITAAASGDERVHINDGSFSVSFASTATDLQEILQEAENHGVLPLEKMDYAEYDPETREIFISRRIAVVITDGNNTLYTETYSSFTVEQILRENGIVLPEGSVCIPKESDRVENGDTILVGTLQVEPAASERGVYMAQPLRSSLVRLNSGMCSVVLKVNDEITQLEVDASFTVEDVLRENGVELVLGDRVNQEKDTHVYNNMNILVKKTQHIRVYADGQTTQLSLYGGTVAQALQVGKITLGKDDIINYPVETTIFNDMEIVIQRVTYGEHTAEEAIPYGTDYEEDGSMYIGSTVVETPGEDGSQEVTYRDRYVDGVLESSEAISSKVIREPVNEKVRTGTLKKKAVKAYAGAGVAVDCNGNSFSYTSVLTGSGTAYYGGGTTSIGLKAQYGVVAVDPTIIPYGTKMYITSCDGRFVYGYCIAGDTGGFAWDGSAIADLYYDTYGECVQFGRRDINIYILG